MPCRMVDEPSAELLTHKPKPLCTRAGKQKRKLHTLDQETTVCPSEKNWNIVLECSLDNTKHRFL